MKKAVAILLITLALSCQHQPKAPLVVTHITDGWEGTELIVDHIAQLSKGRKVLYLAESDPGKEWEMSDNGTYSTKLNEKEVIVCGLYFKACIANTIRSSVENGTEKILLPLDGVAVGKHRTLRDQMKDNWGNDRERFRSGYLEPFFDGILGRYLYRVRVNDEYVTLFLR